MYWKYFGLTKTGKEVFGSYPGKKEDVVFQLENNNITVVEISPDYHKFLEEVFKRKKLSTSVLSLFFKDFAQMYQIGMSINEVATSLSDTTSDLLLKDALRRISNAINDGLTLRNAFENTGVFPKFACISLDAAERSGNVPEVMKILGDYFKFINENKKRILKAMAYPIAVMCALTATTIIISTKLIPQLGAILPEEATQKLSTKIIMNYASFMQDFWWIVALIPVALFFVVQYLWKNHKEELMIHIYKIPVIGDLAKELELTNCFLGLYVYERSGIPVIEGISNLHNAQESYISDRLYKIRNSVIEGSSLWEAFQKDKFFPSFIHHNIKKGELQGNLSEYFHQIYQYYDMKSKDAISAAIDLINPLLLALAISVLGFIILTFFVPLYGGLGNMADSIYK